MTKRIKTGSTVKEKNFLLEEQILPSGLTPNERIGKNKIGRVASFESITIQFRCTVAKDGPSLLGLQRPWKQFMYVVAY